MAAHLRGTRPLTDWIIVLGDLSDLRTNERELQKLQASRYQTVQLARQANSERSLLVLTIPKCGTTWLRYLLINYGRALAEPARGPVQYDELKRYSVDREFLLSGKASFSPTTAWIRQSGLDYILYQHTARRNLALDVWNHLGKKVGVYRNPLDFLVSSYFFFFVNRDERRQDATHPRDLLPKYTRTFASSYALLRDKVLPSGDAALISYEELKRDTAAALYGLLERLGLPLDGAAVEQAVQFSDAAVVAEQESMRKRSLVAQLDRGTFVRDGRVGQWRAYFEDDDLKEVEKILAEVDASLADFDLGEDR